VHESIEQASDATLPAVALPDVAAAAHASVVTSPR
jgi:hypothetical protein